MSNAISTFPTPVNEPVRQYLAGSPERRALDHELKRQAGDVPEIPLVIGGKEIRTGRLQDVVLPHDHRRVIARAHLAGDAEIEMAIRAAVEVQEAWAAMPYTSRAAIFMKAAEMLAGSRRAHMNVATMRNQSKTAHQSEIDAVCELVDFIRFNVKYMEEIYQGYQPPVSPTGFWNQLECRPLEGFVYAVTPFNFTSIAGNLPHSPALMGNTALWKPAPTSLLSNWCVMRLFMEAGLPGGVINFIPVADAPAMSRQVISSEHFAGLHFTGSTAVFRHLWKEIAAQIDRHRTYPRIVGETGGKDFIVAHASADVAALACAIIRGAFEYQGQKCSAASRAYVPRSLWPDLRDRLCGEITTIRVGDPADFRNFMGAVIHEAAFERCRGYIERARASTSTRVIAGGGCDGSTGWFVEPTLLETTDPQYESMREEIFGPIMTVFVYDDDAYDETLALCDRTSPYGLTGSIFASDGLAVLKAQNLLRNAAGNFYINDKPTGAVVGQQPFGGGRASGTNDKAGSPLNLLRWISPRTIKESFDPPVDYRYPWLET